VTILRFQVETSQHEFSVKAKFTTKGYPEWDHH
jgi:hypothetical protein